MIQNKSYPKFSVLMSVYKAENPKYLDEALESIEHQTVVPSEIVLVEDGKLTDQLESVILKHQSNFGANLRVIRSVRNQGLGLALRLGTKFVSNEWIARMDSDDISVPNRFEKQLDEIIRRPEIAVIGGQIDEFVGERGKLVGYRKVPTSESIIRQFIKWRSPFNHPSVMIKKSALEKVGGYLPYGNLEDYYLWSRIISQNYHVLNLDKVLVEMRVDKGMYKRRGRLSNIKYFYQLRKYMYSKRLLTKREQFTGDFLMTVNIIIPKWLRKVIYRYILHRK